MKREKTMPKYDGTFRKVSDDAVFQPGDIFRQVYELRIPDWVPEGMIEDLLTDLVSEGINLQSRINDRIDGSVTVLERDVRELSGRKYEWTVTYQVPEETSSERPAVAPVGAAAVWFAIKAILAIVALFGVYLILKETRKLVETPGGTAVALGALGLGAAYYYDKHKEREASGG